MDYMLTIYPALEAGNPSVKFMFETEAEMKTASDTCACLLLFMQDKAKIMNDYSNMFIKEKKVDGEWVDIDDIDDDEGEDWGDNSESETGYSGECA